MNKAKKEARKLKTKPAGYRMPPSITYTDKNGYSTSASNNKENIYE